MNEQLDHIINSFTMKFYNPILTIYLDMSLVLGSMLFYVTLALGKRFGGMVTVHCQHPVG